jgi:hypothetical protein
MTIDELNRCDTSVTPNVFQYIGPSNVGRRHGRGTYLLVRFPVALLHAITPFEWPHGNRARAFFLCVL